MASLNRILPDSILPVCLKQRRRPVYAGLASEDCFKTEFEAKSSLKYKYDNEIGLQNYVPNCLLKVCGGGDNRLHFLNYYGNGIRSPCIS